MGLTGEECLLLFKNFPPLECRLDVEVGKVGLLGLERAHWSALWCECSIYFCLVKLPVASMAGVVGAFSEEGVQAFW